VEDERSLRRATALFLRRKGYGVLEAGRGSEAVDLWERHREDIRLLFTDMVMPGDLTGMDLANRFRAEKPGLKVIVSSGYSAELSGQTAPADTAVVFVPKPCEAEELAKAVRQLLDESG
jgi:DNA-binding NtrC family response regulator